MRAPAGSQRHLLVRETDASGHGGSAGEIQGRASKQRADILVPSKGPLRAVHFHVGQTSKAGKVSRMGIERQVMQGYLEALAGRGDFPACFTDDVIASFEGTDQTAVGRDRAGRLIRYMHENAFDARAELKNLLVDEGKAAIEADFVGTHTGEFAGIQPTGRSVRVPYSVVYDLRGDKISGLRIYFPMSLLIEQLTG
jgi:predicted ester cyclase